MTTCDPELFKIAMRQLAATVTLVTTFENGIRYGMPATAVTSLSLDPPSLLICVNRSASVHSPTSRRRRFCVNLLADGQKALCADFGALPPASRFSVGTWKCGIDDLPYLADAAASAFCVVDGELEYGTHTIFIGRVVDAIVDARHSPLVFRDGKMGHFTVTAPDQLMETGQ